MLRVFHYYYVSMFNQDSDEIGGLIYHNHTCLFVDHDRFIIFQFHLLQFSNISFFFFSKEKCTNEISIP